MNKGIIFVLIFSLIIVGIILLANPKLTGKTINEINSTELKNPILEKSKTNIPSTGTSSTGTSKPAEIKLEKYLASQPIINDLPNNGLIVLKFYGSEDKTVIDKSYILEKNSVKEGSSNNADIVILVNSKYIGEIKNGLCETVKKANVNGDISVELNMKYSTLMWKYKSLLKYKDCFGL
ncbi:MAG TPA: hypothetical protein P5277_02240 [Candidatus Paceibacterota bacterium]|nr:hypothetical protein [Candidatus Paceibacterota bacterium]